MSSIEPTVSCPPSKVAVELFDSSQCAESLKADGTIYRAVPLSTWRLFLIIAVLSIFSFIYLVYAQYHTYLFYSMTSIVAAIILFIYTYGVFAIIYMVRNDYDYAMDPLSSSGTNNSTDEHSL
ncbi:hypothetical protein PENTCL1PPCAC_19382 [Pristionchus entomophagus]|uniref:Transmembrane protein n=1 Tax=Pristionchus entomophagus TaxID=358040 RepID=A0AAV5TSK7_9BILA|nr:hypothetical protein PENTCL1PPCAC_19382 [Pristionchus entomophagus]